jgi:hypothetical protein
MSERPIASRIWHTRVKARNLYGKEYNGRDIKSIFVKQLK